MTFISPMGPGFFIYFAPGEKVLTDPFQIQLNTVNYKSIQAHVGNLVSIPIGIAQRSEHSMKIIK